MQHKVIVGWQQGPVAGTVEVFHARLTGTRILGGRGSTGGSDFCFSSTGSCRLELAFDAPELGPGPESPRVTLRTRENPFSFFLRDVNRRFPIFIPHYRVAVTEAGDARSCAQVETAIRKRGLQTKLQQIECAPEETYEAAAAHTRNLHCPTWLGLSRDIRIFEVGVERDAGRWFYVQPRFHGYPAGLPETKEQPVQYNFFLGRGIGVVRNITRRLEDGVLPILHIAAVDEDVTYDCIAFASLERSPLTAATLRGTHFLVADGYGHGHMFTPEQQKQREGLLPREMERQEETVLWARTVAVNNSAAPRYAWFRTLAPLAGWSYDGATGFASWSEGRVLSISRLNGKPLPQDELAILLQPGEKAVFEFILPHRPVSRKRAARLARQSFDRRHAECRAFWQAKLDAAATWRLPEKRIDEMVRAGLLHLDLVTYGLEPKGTLAACIGVYCPIGSESSPIIQFMDSMGLHDAARRSLMYFMDKQHDDGFIQNFGNYMLETGAALWSIGEHWRLTRDDAWIRSIKAKLIKSCDYMLAWRGRNMREDLRGRGYGMLEGKVADPADLFHIFMLNGYAYLGLIRVAEMLAKLDPAESRRLSREADSLKLDIRAAFFDGMASAPVVPLSDGTWCPTVAPWAEAVGPVCLYAERGRWFTHGAFLGRDSMLGPIYLLLQEVIDPREAAADMLVNASAELYHQRNAAFSQPYYSPHLLVHAMRGEVKPFLKGYYNTFSALADRQTYTFWEHTYHVSPHKTHEESWFLMQTKAMLWREEGGALRLLPAVPRAWLEDGKKIELDNIATYFGRASLRVESRLKRDGTIRATVECPSARRPQVVELRLPHPQGRKPTAATGGRYDAHSETVRIENFRGKAAVTLRFR
jgi:hypothetical protein